LEVRQIIERQYERTRSILQANVENLHKAAGVLLAKETITGEELAVSVTSGNPIHGSSEVIGSSIAAASK
jgi:ATP-dependent Zn protease